VQKTFLKMGMVVSSKIEKGSSGFSIGGARRIELTVTSLIKVSQV